MMQLSQVFRLDSETDNRREDGQISSKVLTYSVANSSMVQSTTEYQ